MMQWNVLLTTDCPNNHWLNAFIEAQGRFAQSVQHPELELQRDHLMKSGSSYSERSANGYLIRRLNSSYAQINADETYKYDAALYWRFVYEQFNDMRVIRAALTEMANSPHRDIVKEMPGLMSRAFRQLDGPVSTFEESLVAFARSNYALRLTDGRCTSANLTDCGGRYYDPHGLYANPPLDANLYFRGTALTYDGTIPSSFGMDFIEVGFGQELHRKPFLVTIEMEGTVAQFDVQIWKLSTGGAQLHAVTPEPEALTQDQVGVYTYAIPDLDLQAYDRLTIMVTRLDADEASDPAGRYHVTLVSPGFDAGGGQDASLDTFVTEGQIAD